jgi:tetratricopeptide (TPR) repeat protein
VAENPRIEELRRRVQADPASIAFAALAEEFRRVGRLEDAIETCRTGLQRHPAYLSARVTLGRALLEIGDYDAARDELQTVLRSAPENLAAIRGLELIEERLGHSTEMHPDLHAIAREAKDARDTLALATPEPPPPPPPPPPLAFEPGAIAFESPVLTPSALDASAGKPAVTPSAPDEPERASDTDTSPFAGLTFDQAAPPPPDAAETPFSWPGQAPDQPDAATAARLLRLERFLDAIQTARHA